jgi:carbonic anhydrase
MRKLIMGIVEFRERMRPQYAERFRELALGQAPDALLITCSDSRVTPELLASTHPGDLFTMRNVGNLVPPAHVDGMSTGDVSEASAIEYALHELKVANIVICGHSECGAMKAALKPDRGSNAPNLERWLAHATPAVLRLGQEGPLDLTLKPHDQLSQHNVLVQMEHLMTYPVVREQVDGGALVISGCWFDIASGDIYAYEREKHAFSVIDRAVAERMIGQVAVRALEAQTK